MAARMAQAAGTISGVTLSAVLSRDRERATSFCRSFAPAATGFADTASLLACVDAVYVASSPDQHGQIILSSIDAGKPVLCEKPLTPSAEETRQILARADAAGVLLMEAIWTLALPAYRKLAESIGCRRTAFLQFDLSHPVDARAGSHHFDPLTGGVLLDRAVYGYAAAISLLGTVASQSVSVMRNDAGLDTSAVIILEHAEGAHSVITLSMDRQGPNFLHVYNELGLMSLGPNSLTAESFQQSRQSTPRTRPDDAIYPGIKEKLKSTPALRALKTLMPSRAQFLSFGASPYRPILLEFLSSIEQGKTQSAIVPHRLSGEIADLVSAARAIV